ncbi:MAG TPA: ATP-binding protein [Candidatus Saccharimonadales bacterium]|nr:ATP-binding protein [Candidatus Saccharimonadales bacterium]
MFQSATVKLTAWYLAILVAISLLFSIVIYSTASSEIVTRLGYFKQDPRIMLNIPANRFDSLRDIQVNEARNNLIISLIITNLCIWIAGGVGSYYLARRTLTPIEEAHEAQSRFTSDASHELRTPLASMKTEIEVALRDPALTKGEMREQLASNLEEVNKLTKLSQTLLQLSQLDHKNIPKEKVKLSPTVKSVIEKFDKTGERIGFADAKAHNVLANQSSIEELLTILLDNALKYSPSDSQVKVSLMKQKQMSGFEISNEGQGISAEVLPHIFDRFYRADSSRTNGDKKGYGLGLALAKKIVELHSGELTVSSAEGKVTTFRVLLPNLRQPQAENQ